ncbi:hypothetical protein EUGRSUZ_B02281 [Eucalyptus grandis]|uniref:Uncharacterized protein n=2 Tax=Eucalyptus grandis TaxID=71139 RepID=A0A059D426_EUCGR|nr:hypothetical protein EUGRSUZ_B02281 [Eucalyptus grandis]
MAGKVSNFSDLIQRVTASCLLHPLAAGTRHDSGELASDSDDGERECGSPLGIEDTEEEEEEEEEEEKEEGGEKVVERSKREARAERLVAEMEAIMNDVFDTVSAMKRAYGSLQEAHCPWDAEKMRAADVAVVAELRRLAVLRERYRRSLICHGGGRRRVGSRPAEVREVVAPYEAALEEMKREAKAREVEVDNLKEKLRSSTSLNARKGRSLSKRRLSCTQSQAPASPAPELFEVTMSQVREASKSFTSLLLSLMRAAHWDIASAVRSIEAAGGGAAAAAAAANASIVGVHHAKYALESYVARKIFQGFDHETFYMDGSLSSLLNPGQYRRDCFGRYRDMKAMDPVELLGVLPSCDFGKFCAKKYLAIVHAKMEESFFGSLEHQQQVGGGGHPRTEFYGEFLKLAKAVWLLHLLAFALDPAPSLFEASRGAEFHPQYMESVVRFSGGQVPAGHVVGFPVSPGFKLGNGSVVKARVYLVSRV